MVREITPEELAALQSKGGTVKSRRPANKRKKKKVALSSTQAIQPRTIPTQDSSPDMKAAVAAAQRAADAAISTAQVANGLMEETSKNNRLLLTEVVDIITANQVIKMKVNRGKDTLISDVDLIRN